MDILQNSLSLVQNPLDEQAQNIRIGQSFAQSFIQGYNRGVDQKREDERWAEGAPLREAQLTAARAQAESTVARSKIDAIGAANAAKQQEKMAEFAGLAGQVSESGWNPTDRVKLYDFLKKNPEFYGSPFHQQMEAGFNNAAKARMDEEEWRTRLATQITEERIRQEGRSVAKPGLTEDQRIILRGKISALKADPQSAVPGWLDKGIQKLAEEFGITAPEVVQADQGGATVADGGKPESGPKPIKIVKGPDGKLMVEGSEQAQQAAPQAVKQPKRQSVADIIGPVLGDSQRPSVMANWPKWD